MRCSLQKTPKSNSKSFNLSLIFLSKPRPPCRVLHGDTRFYIVNLHWPCSSFLIDVMHTTWIAGVSYVSINSILMPSSILIADGVNTRSTHSTVFVCSDRSVDRAAARAAFDRFRQSPAVARSIDRSVDRAAALAMSMIKYDTVMLLCTNVFFFQHLHAFLRRPWVFLVLSAAGHAGGPPVKHGARLGPGRAPWRVLWGFKIAKHGK